MFASLHRMVVPALLVLVIGIAAAAQTSPLTEEPAAAQDAQTEPAETSVEPSEPIDLTELLFKQIEIMREEMNEMRVQLAQAQLEASSAQRERDELKQFINDHDQYRSDFAQYQGVKAAAEREARQKELDEIRRQREAERAQREARQRAAREQRRERDAMAARVQRYRNAGFTPIGLDVFTGRMAFFYNETNSSGGAQVQWNVDIGRFLSPLPPLSQIDYSQMTISGSVINASEETRNIGVAITFFDDNGNQVGHEIVQIKNARPDVPYPFTSKIDMALNRAFNSSSIYVLYADPAEAE